jgi:hypothetical protein
LFFLSFLHDLRGSDPPRFRFPGYSPPFRFSISVKVGSFPLQHHVKRLSPLFPFTIPRRCVEFTRFSSLLSVA